MKVNYILISLIWGDLAGEPVRHHKFPSLDVIANGLSPFVEGSLETVLKLLEPFSFNITFDKLSGSETDGNAKVLPIKVVSSSDPHLKDIDIREGAGSNDAYRLLTDVPGDADVWIFRKMSYSKEPHRCRMDALNSPLWYLKTSTTNLDQAK